MASFVEALAELLCALACLVAAVVAWLAVRFWIGMVSLVQGDPDMESYL